MKIEDLFTIKIVDKRMRADIYCTEAYKEYDDGIIEEQFKQFLTTSQVVYGIHDEVVTNVVNNLDHGQFPLTIATGIKPEDGENGFVTYTFDENVENEDTSSKKDVDFRDVMNIPSVKENAEIAVETPPTKGKSGKNVSGIAIQPRPGKRKVLRAGKNVRYEDENHTFYATAEGQVSVLANSVEVHDLFIVRDTLSMETGNVDFIGSVEIHGDVPTGYTVKAGGDIRVFGLVEAATLVAGGSVFISEGFAGLQKGTIIADADVHVSYVNQGSIQAGQSIYVKNSILHSTCNAEQSIICESGNIIGGSLTAGFNIQARDIGNRVQTQTNIMINEDEQMYDEEHRLEEKLEKINTTIKQLKLIGNKLKKNAHLNDPKMRVTLLRQRRSMQQMLDEEKEIQDNIDRLKQNYFHDGEASIIVQNQLYANVTIAFGKYQQTTQKDYTFVQCRFLENAISIESV